jgi:flagellar P-ring protein precursor FlgI
MARYGTVLQTITGAAVLALCAGPASATTIQDLVWVKGHERAVLTGMGIVVGLDGTGDTAKDSLVAARPFAKLLTNLGNPVDDVTELAKANAFAIVSVTMEVPPAGVRDGDRLDVTVDKLFNATSLAGGRLFVSMLRLPGPDTADSPVMAFAEGPLVVDPAAPGTATIRDGGQMLQDVRTEVVARDGTITLVLRPQYAGFPVATTLASAIDDEFSIDGFSNLSVVEDAKNIRVHVPEEDRAQPAAFIATLLLIPIDPSLIQIGARIVINERAGIITATGDVEIGPVAITHRGMRLTSLGGGGAPPPGVPPADRRWIGLDTTTRPGETARLADLLTAFDQLQVPTEDQIAILYELRKTGALHAEILSQ